MIRGLLALSRRSASTKSVPGSECFVWGKGGEGALGLGDRKDCSLPEILEFNNKDEDVKCFAAGSEHSSVIDTSNRLWTFGKADYGRLGIPGQTSGIVPVPTLVDVPLEDGDYIIGVDCGYYHTAAVSNNGRVYTWGWGGNWYSGCGGLGHGDTKSVLNPKMVEALSDINISQVRCGKYHTLALSKDGTLYSWGRGEYGRLGLNSNSDVLVPKLVPEMNDIAHIATCNATSAAIDSRGRLFMWGKNDTGQLGIGGSSNLDMFALEPVPTLIEAFNDQKIADVSCSDRHTVACTDDGRVYVWGDRQWMSPYELSSSDLGNAPVVQVAAGHNFSAILTSAGNVFTWGSGRTGCLGHGDKDTVREPTFVDAFDGRNVLSIVVGAHHAGALLEFNRTDQ
uniref:RCC1-like domain-containing protein n=1 Tax=Spongospora subterranea TaxID=70186 RepID=A0A0H5RL00_9EUKA|eukprot:CRZ09399.1 hypothetical protein [Spongospora subterranea]